ncbi:hypothetical protein ACFXPI_17865 [Streptomyces sp. NPDC059104]
MRNLRWDEAARTLYVIDFERSETARPYGTSSACRTPGTAGRTCSRP